MNALNFLFLSCMVSFALYCVFGLCINADIGEWDKTTAALFVVLTLVLDLIIANHLTRKTR
jgi:hypothetical protein